MKIAVFQLNATIGDLKGNFEKIKKSIQRGKEMGADVCLFPEMSLCGYPPQDLVLHRDFIDKMEHYLHEIIALTEGIAVVVGLVRRNLDGGEKPLYNSVAVIEDRRLVGFQDKWLLPNYDVFSEARYFQPGKVMQIFVLKGVRCGVLICEDIWKHAGFVSETKYTRDPVEELKKLGPQVLLNLTASPYQYQKMHIRIKVLSRVAKSLNCPVVYCCQIGGNDQLIFDGLSLVVSQEGHLIHRCKSFVEDEYLFDLANQTPGRLYGLEPYENLRRALVLGIKDYFGKLGFTKACLGLSGGIDSAVVACLAVDALGKENVWGVMLPSRFSSKGSVEDAKLLAERLGIGYNIIEIESVHTAFLHTLSPLFDGKKEDVTEENLQARIRGVILMALSNKFGHIVLSTGNKSEMALGYCTLYGDMCGGLGVIGDVKKTEVYKLARWYNKESEIIPQSTIDKPPSAELRPNQIDLDSLPEYGIIDEVLQGYVEDNLSAEEVAITYSIPLDTVKDLVRRIHAAEYKRQQGAPVLRVSKKSFGSGRRYPIVQKFS